MPTAKGTAAARKAWATRRANEQARLEQQARQQRSERARRAAYKAWDTIRARKARATAVARA